MLRADADETRTPTEQARPSSAARALIVLASSASVAAGANAKAGQPLAYTFRIATFDVTATFTSREVHGEHSLAPRVAVQGTHARLAWTHGGPFQCERRRPARVSLVGEATYSGPDASCSGKLAVRSSRSRPVLVVLLYFGDRVRVYVQKFPLATAYPGQDSGLPDDPSLGRCEKAVVDWYENAEVLRPPTVFRRPSFTVTAQRKERFEDGEAIEWTLRMTVKRIRYRPIDCKTATG